MRPISLLGLALVTACGGGAAGSSLARAVTDSLPGGIPRVVSPGPTAWTDSAGAVLVEEARWSGADGTPAELGEPRSLAVDGEGRVYVVDSKPSVIKVFGPDGAFVRTIGGEGEGPGEFRVGFIAVRGDRVVLHDPRLGRTSVWDTAGTFLKSWITSCCYWTDIQVDRANRIYVPTMTPGRPGEPRRGNPWVRWTMEGAVIDTIWVPPAPAEKYWTVEAKKGGKVVSMMSTSIPFRPSLAVALDPDGGFFLGMTDRYEIRQSRTGADTARVFGRAWTPDPVTDARRSAELESRIKGASEGFGEANVRSAFRLEDIPSTLPAFLNLRADEAGRIWVRRWAVSDTTRSDFDVFDLAGAWLGSVTVPFKVNEWGSQAWTRDGLVTITEDADGRPTVVRLRLQIR